MKPTKTTDHSAVSMISSAKPIGPLAIVMPNARASSTIADAMMSPLTASAIRRPSTIAVRGMGDWRSLSK